MKKMNEISTAPRRNCPLSRSGIVSLLAGGLLCVGSTLNAQTADSHTADSNSQPAMPSGTYATPSTSYAPTPSTGNSSSSMGGKLPFLFSASVTEIYDDNIFIQPIKTSDFITQINLRGEYKIGDKAASDSNFFDASYAPSFDLYAHHSKQDSFNQLVSVLYEHRFSRLQLGLEQDYSKQSSTSASAGNLVTASVYTTTGTANYQFSDKLSLRSTSGFAAINYETAGYSSSNEWSENIYALYQLDSKISIGVGPRFGWLDISGAPNQTYQQLLGHVEYKYSRKVTFDLSGGGEVREYQGSVTGDKLSPVFNLEASYMPWDSTVITLSGGRRYLPSYNFTGQDYIDTNVALTGRQRFFQKFHYSLGLGYENDSYEGAGIAVVGPTRTDDYYYATTGVDWDPNTWLTASIFYKYQKDDSNLQTANFNDNQAGVSLSISY